MSSATTSIPAPSKTRHNASAADDSSDDEPEPLQFKVVILGDGAVGKTSTIARFTSDSFSQSYKQTIGVDFFSRQLVLPNSTPVTLQVWDIGGQTIGSQMLTSYIYGAQAVLLLYDITNYTTFQDATEDWYDLTKKAFSSTSTDLPLLALCANKCDLQHLRAVSVEKHNQFCVDNSLYSFFLSAKTGDSVNTCFFKIAASLAGCQLTDKDLEVNTRVVKAQVIQYTQNDKAEKEEDETKSVQQLAAQKDKKKCTIM